MGKARLLDPEALARRCDPSSLGFATTAELEPLAGVVGQERAVEAVDFGIGIAGDGFNVFACGPSGLGKRTLITALLSAEAAARPAPNGWCYVHNFSASHRPRAVSLPPGVATELQRSMRKAIEDLKTAIPATLESQEFQRRVSDIQEEFKEQQDEKLSALSREVEGEGLRLLRTPDGFAFAPVRAGEVVSPEEFAKLSEEEQAQIQKAIEAAQEKLAEILRGVIQSATEARDRVREESRKLIRAAVASVFEDLRARFAGHAAVIEHLDAASDEIVEHPEDFRRDAAPPVPVPVELPGMNQKASLARYEINVLVDVEDGGGAPVVYEEHPTLANLVGHADYQSRFGALTTDFTMLKPGALHRANGGFLVLDARKVLMQPFAWEALKRALHAREIRIESASQIMAILSTVAPEPEPIPLDVKIVLVGDRMLYYLLHQLDPDFANLFKVQADFDDEIERTSENERLYARVIATMAKSRSTLAFDAAAVARVIDRTARLADDSTKLTAHMGAVCDLVREAEHRASRRGSSLVEAADVDAAVEAKQRRAGRMRGLLLERIRRGIVLVATEGSVVGQVNGLSVLSLGDVLLGQPSRITVTARIGNGEVVDIEREARLGGPTHSKGVLILSHFLATRFAKDKPLALSASIVFEQSYGMIDGDSASLGELCALLSALADAPISQSLAITGSVDQNGRAQPIGGVNEKIEGFFDACREHGAVDAHGVVVPASNTEHLLLREDVVEAVREGRFRVWAVESVDEAIEILTGVEAGERAADGSFGAGTVNGRVQARLDELFDKRRRLTKGTVDAGDGHAPSTEPAGPPPTPELPGPEGGKR